MDASPPILAEKPLVRNILILISRQGEGPLLPGRDRFYQ